MVAEKCLHCGNFNNRKPSAVVVETIPMSLGTIPVASGAVIGNLAFAGKPLCAYASYPLDCTIHCLILK